MTQCRSFLLPAIVLLAACQPEASGGTATGNIPSGDSNPYDGIAVDETLQFTGTEPFWGGQVTHGTLTYKTPEDLAGQTIAVERFAGRGGLSFDGTLEGKPFIMTATPSPCSDGMSDRTYPFAVTLKIGEETRNGCGWTDQHPFEGPPSP
jgi:uncharacterized membrane protein